jgi:HK97 family phage prohead protease
MQTATASPNKKQQRTTDEVKEVRYVTVELRADGENGDPHSRTIYGHAAVFNVWAQIGGYFRERIAPGAFAPAINRSDIRALFNHDPNHLLARTKSGTLRVSEDEKGLAFEFDLPKSRQDLLESIRRGDLADMSFAFRVKTQEWRYNEPEDMDERTITEFDELYDVALVTYPAYQETDVNLRSYQEYRDSRTANDDIENKTETQEDTEQFPALAQATRTLSLIQLNSKTLLR